MTICERTGVWAALSERSYGGIGFDSDGILSGLIKAKADVRSTTKNAHTQAKRAFLDENPKDINYQSLVFTMRLVCDSYPLLIPSACAIPLQYRYHSDTTT